MQDPGASSDAHWLPCRILHDGDGGVSAHFVVEKQPGEGEAQEVLTARFRGRRLEGRRLSLGAATATATSDTTSDALTLHIHAPLTSAVVWDVDGWCGEDAALLARWTALVSLSQHLL